MEYNSRNVKFKPEKQRRNINIMLFGQYLYIYPYVNVCIQLFIYILL